MLRLALAECGFRTAEDLANAHLVELLKVPGIGSVSAPRLIAAAKTAIAEEEPNDLADKSETRLMTTSSPPSAAEYPTVGTGADDTTATKAKTQKKKKKKKKKAKAVKQAAKLQAKVAKEAAKQKAKAAKKAAKLAAKVAKKAAKLNATRKEQVG